MGGGRRECLDLRYLGSVLPVLEVSRPRKTSSLSRNPGLVSDLELEERRKGDSVSALGLAGAEMRWRLTAW